MKYKSSCKLILILILMHNMPYEFVLYTSIYMYTTPSVVVLPHEKYLLLDDYVIIIIIMQNNHSVVDSE